MDEETKSAMESGKPVMIFHINNVGQLNPNATVVNNNYWGDEYVPAENKDGTVSGAVRRSTGKPKAAKIATPNRKSSVPKLTPKPANEKPRERMTFKKRGITDAHVSLLYHKMLELAWISPDNNEQDFRDLFSGELSDCKVIWGSKYGKSTLAFLFKYFESEGVITVAKGFTIPNILMGHFVDEDGNYLTNLDNGDAPAPKSGEESVELLNTLKINAGRQGRRSCREDYDDEEDSSLNPHELNVEGLHYTDRP